VVRRLLADESPDDWPVSARYLGREAFADEVAAALVAGDAKPVDELARFSQRYARFLDDRAEVDAGGLFTAATQAAAPGRYDHILVDDHDPTAAGANGLLAALVGADTGLTVVSEGALGFPATEITLTEAFRQPAAPAVVVCPHPSTEAEAVAGELLAARAEGVAWSAMAVLVRRIGARSRAVTRALGRHGIPVAGGIAGAGAGDPAVVAIVDLLSWANGDETVVARLMGSPLAGLGRDGLEALRADVAAAAGEGQTVAELAFTVWERGLGHLVGGEAGADASLDAVVAFVDALERRADVGLEQPGLAGLQPDAWRVSQATRAADAVTVTSVDAAVGREWHTVVLAGCVEGEWPLIHARARLFEASPTSAAARRQESVAAERERFGNGCARATARVVATAAPAPGVLLSRFVEGWPRHDARPPRRTAPMMAARTITENPTAVFPGGDLVLSASQLATYDDCPLRYAYQYGLRVRDEAGAPAALGTLVHEVLAEFLRPGGPERSHQALLAIAAEKWRDDIARYRPQVEECRRDYFAMLEQWWAAEGEGPRAPEVLCVEKRFDIVVGDIRLVGAIDRVDRAADGEGIRIVDYKTGRNEPRSDSLADDLQLAVYHLAATRDPELAAFGPPRQLQLLYLRTMHCFEQPIVAGHAEATEARVMAAVEAIRAEWFDPAVDASCRTCPFHRLCPLQAAGREVGAA
jgi:RecB family exonuclease